MSPSEFTQSLSVLDDHIKTAATAAASLLGFAVAVLVAAFAAHLVNPGLAATSAALAVAGGLAAFAASRMLGWRRTDLYDEIVLAGYRHVSRDAVAGHVERLLAPERRRRFADTLEQYLEIALRGDLSAVPLARTALRDVETHVRGLSARLRASHLAVDPAGMVLVRRLLTDGATSPLFATRSNGDDLAQAIESIHSQLGPMPVIQLRLPADTEPLRLAA
jgi:hypothetical protein